ncbi:glycosyltransferase family 39 protein [Myxococcota bacterium]|nr:glycosyltransferase family 39 protein [Myxococcota bacterium]
MLGRFGTPLALVLVGFWLRLGGARDHWLNPDEGLRHFIAKAPLAEAWELVLRNAHPPLFPAVSRFSSLLADDGVLWLRSTSLICGSLAIGVLYAAGRRLHGPLAGLTAAALLVVSPGAVAMSQVARPYALQLLGITAALLFAVRLLQTGDRRDLYAYAACITAAMMTHYGTFLVLSAMAGALWLGAGSERVGVTRRDVIRAHLPVAALLALLLWVHVLPRLWDSPLRTSAVEGWLSPHFGGSPSTLIGQTFGTFSYLAGPAFGGTLALVYGFSCVTCWWSGRRALVGASMALWAVALILATASLYPIGPIRHVLYLAPFVFLVIGVATAEWVARGPIAVASVTAGIGLWLWAGQPLEAALQLPPRTASTYAELNIHREEGFRAGEALRKLAHSPGDLVIDRSTAFTLAPVLGQALVAARPLGSTGIDEFQWGKRRVLMVNRWLLEVSVPARDPAAHLAHVLATVDLSGGNVWLVTARGPRLVGELDTFAKGSILSVMAGPTIQMIALDPERYRSALERDRGNTLMEEIGPRVDPR